MDFNTLYNGRHISKFEYLLSIIFRFTVGTTFTILFIKEKNILFFINLIYSISDIFLIIEFAKNKNSLSQKQFATRLITFYYPLEYIYSFFMLVFFIPTALFPLQAIWAVIFLYINSIKLKSKYFSAFISFMIFSTLLYNFTLPIDFLVNFIYTIAAAGIILADELQRKTFSNFEKTISENIEGKNKEISRISDNIELSCIAFEAIESHTTKKIHHNLRLSKYAYLLATIYGLHPNDALTFSKTIIYHDIGNAFINKDLLHKKEPLSPDEFEEIKKHTLFGYNYLKNETNPLLELASTIALEHHEYFNGSGYPFGKFGEQINIFSRMTTLLDVFDSMSQKKPYRNKYTLEKVLEYIDSNKGIHFDPLLVDFFIENLEKFILIRDEFKNE